MKKKGEIIMKENILTIIIIIVIIIVVAVLIVGLNLFYKTFSEENTINGINTVLEDETTNTQKSSNSDSIVNENEEMLKPIIDKFNSCTVVQRLKAQDVQINAHIEGNQIVIFYAKFGGSSVVRFTNTNNILSTEIVTKSDPYVSATDALFSTVLIDCIGQIKGLPEGKIEGELNDGEELPTYSLEKDGLEMLVGERNGKPSIIFNVDLTSNFPTLWE